MSGLPGNIAPADISASEVPDGFSFGPGAGGGGGGVSDQAAQKAAQRESVLQQAMTPDALARLRRLKLVKKERASAVEAMICNMAMQGKMDSKISEGKLIEMLENIVGASQTKQSGNSSKMTFARKKNAFDSDSDDNDDDLL